MQPLPQQLQPSFREIQPSDCGCDGSSDEGDIDLPLMPACIGSCSMGGVNGSTGSGATVRLPADHIDCDGPVGGGGCLGGSSSSGGDQQLHALPGMHIPCLITVLTRQVC
jgi:hypothetical protein